MKIKPRLIAAALAPGIVLALWLVLGLAGAWSLTNPAERGILSEVLAPLANSHGALVFGWWAVAAALGGWLVMRLYRRTIAPLHAANGCDTGCWPPIPMRRVRWRRDGGGATGG
ncbi:hypothetical protein PE067_17940 [Paracoccus sp. DMF-8]|uniref:hypothetical protein n=1 Tax=Paracoccus sp. DMF-8 TaxID=3019445 RepID=UPI0023E414E5|nr:hypothetical protein [Paracoccus sp. DMF-8]MDF3607858.1 hypothetical protein [Paracoccus sp. DMF-8]